MKIATWNVNSIKVRYPQVIAWLNTSQVDALVMQETKVIDEAFPREEFAQAGFDYLTLGQKTYNGVALVTRRETIASVTDPIFGMPGYPDEQKRFIAAHITAKDGARILFAGCYFPNGQAVGSAKYLYKLDWIAALTLWVKKMLAAGEPLVVAGDFNIAPTDADVWNPEGWKGNILVSEPERSAFFRLLSCGMIDTWGLNAHAPETYTWWDYRQFGFDKNHGLRIDIILAAQALAAKIKNVQVDTAPRAQDKPSDHAPVMAEISA